MRKSYESLIGIQSESQTAKTHYLKNINFLIKYIFFYNYYFQKAEYFSENFYVKK